MPTVSIDVNVYCSCGEGLCNQSTEQNGRYGPQITIEPCQRCLDLAQTEGYDEGYADAQHRQENNHD